MKITKAVIPVAGKGTRFLPATKQIPKEMIPLVDRPMIHYAVEEAVRSGIEEIIFVTSSNKQSIENYFDRNLELEAFLEKQGKNDALNIVQNIGKSIDIISVRQKEQLGLGHAINCARHLIGKDEAFAVILADDLVISDTPVTKQLMDVSKANGGSSVIGVMQIDPKESHKYGVIRISESSKDNKTHKFTEMVEKPKPEDAPSNLATPGRYILNYEIFQYLENLSKGVGGEYQLTDAINEMAKKDDFYGHVFEGERYDTGSIEGFLAATLEFSLQHPEYSEKMKQLILEKVNKYGL